MEETFISEYIKQPQIITPDDGGHYFFGYYDMRASQGSRHLAHRVSFMDRMQEADDVAEVGYLEDGKWKGPQKKSMFCINVDDASFVEYDMPYFHESHNPDIRCDLHNQFVFGGKYISYDTTENGCRQIALVPVDILNF